MVQSSVPFISSRGSPKWIHSHTLSPARERIHSSVEPLSCVTDRLDSASGRTFGSEREAKETRKEKQRGVPALSSAASPSGSSSTRSPSGTLKHTGTHASSLALSTVSNNSPAPSRSRITEFFSHNFGLGSQTSPAAAVALGDEDLPTGRERAHLLSKEPTSAQKEKAERAKRGSVRNPPASTKK